MKEKLLTLITSLSVAAALIGPVLAQGLGEGGNYGLKEGSSIDSGGNVVGDLNFDLGENIIFPAGESSTTPSIQFGTIGIRSPSTNVLRFSQSGADQFSLASSTFCGNISGSPCLLNEASSSSNPSLIPSNADVDTGLGTGGSDIFTVIAGGIKAIEATETGSAISKLTVAIPQGSISATCEVNELFYDTDTTHELCFCTATDTWSCISVTTTSGPTD